VLKRLSHRSHHLTPTLHRALQMIQHVIHQTGSSPFATDIARSLGMKWPPQQGYDVVNALRELGYIATVGSGQTRTIKIIRLPLDLVPAGYEEGCQAMREAVLDLLRGKHLHLLVDEIAALPSPALDLADVPQPSPVKIPLFRRGVPKPKPPKRIRQSPKKGKTLGR
jgi:hypothetical protein